MIPARPRAPGARSAFLRSTFWLAGIAYFLMAAAWAVALPTNGTYDEKHHIVRAYAVASGQWFPSGHATEGTGFGTEAFRVPGSLLPGDVDCTWYPTPQPASCQTPAGGADRTLVVSAAARYSPVYYAVVGAPLVISPNRTGVVAARLLSALLSALLLAAASAVAAKYGGALQLAAIALVATPMVMNLAGAINPNGLEIAAAVLLFAVLLALGRQALDRGVSDRLLLGLAALATFLLMTVRQLGPVLWLVVVVACAAVAAPGRVRELAADRRARRIVGGAGLAGLAFFAAWTVAAGASHVNPDPQRALALSTGSLLGKIATVRVPFYLQQAIGQFGYGETTISTLAVVAWYALWAAVVIPALMVGGRRLRLTVAGLGAFCALTLVGLELRYAGTVGWSQHGRYVLPAAVGIVLIAATRRWPGARWWLPVVLVAATVPLHTYALARAMTRFQVGIDAGLDPLGGSWLPAGGGLAPLALAVAGALAATAVVARSSRVITPKPALDN